MAQTIRCPKCKTEQPKQAVCAHCGFDIRAYALARQQPHITCPNCKMSVTRQTVCSACGFDIRAYALAHGQKAQPPSPASPGGTPPGTALPPSGIAPLGDLFSLSWDVFKNRWGILLGLYVLGFLFALGFFIIPVGVGAVAALLVPDAKVYVLVIAFLLAAIFGYLGMSWGMAATTAATVDRTLGVKDALVRGWRMAPSYIWITIAASLVIWGGSMLLVIPGVVFLVWAFAAQFIVFAEQERGMGALLKSRAYVKGNCTNTFAKLFVIMLCMFAAGFVPLGSVIFFPFFLIFLHEMYRDLRRAKGPVLVYSGTAGAKALWLGTGVLGLALPIALAVLLGGPALKGAVEELRAGDVMTEEFSSYKRPAPFESTEPGGDTVRPHEYGRIVGAWSGRGPDGSSGWQFVFTDDYQVFFTAPNGKGVVSDASEVFVDLGGRPGSDSVRVPPGASLLDFKVVSADTGLDIGKISLGVYKLESDARMTLCLSRPGVHVRAAAYESSGDISCFALERISSRAHAPSSPGEAARS